MPYRENICCFVGNVAWWKQIAAAKRRFYHFPPKHSNLSYLSIVEAHPNLNQISLQNCLFHSNTAKLSLPFILLWKRKRKSFLIKLTSHEKQSFYSWFLIQVKSFVVKLQFLLLLLLLFAFELLFIQFSLICSHHLYKNMCVIVLTFS